ARERTASFGARGEAICCATAWCADRVPELGAARPLEADGAEAVGLPVPRDGSSAPQARPAGPPGFSVAVTEANPLLLFANCPRSREPALRIHGEPPRNRARALLRRGAGDAFQGPGLQRTGRERRHGRA